MSSSLSIYSIQFLNHLRKQLKYLSLHRFVMYYKRINNIPPEVGFYRERYCVVSVYMLVYD